MRTVVASAPGKVILLGEHGVNRGRPALATAVGLRAWCRVRARADGRYTFASGDRRETVSREQLVRFKSNVEAWRAADRPDLLREATAGDFFAPARYGLAHLASGTDGPGLDIEWRSTIPVGSGIGSGAAATSAMLLAASQVLGAGLEAGEIARLAWQGDVVAHGGVASGLDSGACVLGGVTRYTLADGPQSLPCPFGLPLVIADTLVCARTGDVNARVRAVLTAHPSRAHLFGEMDLLVRAAQDALEAGDLPTLGRLLNLNQMLLERLGVSSPEIERLAEAALEAGALGAKLSGSGRGGIVIALARHGAESEVAAAMEAAGGRVLPAPAGVPGVQVEDETVWEAQGGAIRAGVPRDVEPG